MRNYIVVRKPFLAAALIWVVSGAQASSYLETGWVVDDPIEYNDPLGRDHPYSGPNRSQVLAECRGQHRPSNCLETFSGLSRLEVSVFVRGRRGLISELRPVQPKQYGGLAVIPA